MTFFLLFDFHLVPQVSDILLPHLSHPNSFCLGAHFHESPTDLISCEANMIPFVSQDLDLDLSYPGSRKHRTEASIRVPRMFNHTHGNNMINR
jgi:hypothetical protein